MPTPIQTLVSVIDGNDSIHVATGHEGGMGPTIDIPAGQRWTLVRLSEQFYVPQQNCNPQDAMFHVVAKFGNWEGNIHTQTLRTQESDPGDGKPYWDYRNHDLNIPIVGPANVRVVGYNHTPWSIVFAFVALWSRESLP